VLLISFTLIKNKKIDFFDVAESRNRVDLFL